MIIEYHRPKTIPAALKLLARSKPPTYPLGGGTELNRPTRERIAVVDLQELGLNKIRKAGNYLEIGPATTLQTLSEYHALPEALNRTLNLEANHNLRQIATLAGTLFSSEGYSPLTTTLLALDAKLTMQPGDEEITLGNLLPLRRKILHGKLITKITIPIQARLAFEYVARTPVDRPIVCVALSQWPSGRRRLALGGFGPSPRLAMDGKDITGIETAVIQACADAEDERASSAYRSEVAAILARRCLDQIASLGN